MESLKRPEWGDAYIRNRDVVFRKIAGELFLVPIRGKLADMERIFALTPVAEFIWEMLDGQRSLDEVRAAVVDNFDVDTEQAGSDIMEFIGELLEAGLVVEAGD